MTGVNEITVLSRGAVPDDRGLFDALTQLFDAADARLAREIAVLRAVQIFCFAAFFAALI